MPRVVHVCSYSAVLAPGADTVAEIVAGLREGATISYDINMRPSLTGAGPDVVARVERLCGMSDVVKCSDEDLAALHPGLSEADGAARLLERGPAVIVVTRGAAGATAVTEHGIVEVDAPATEVADTIGAGDTFGAATIDALWSRGLLGGGAREALRSLDAGAWREVLRYAAGAAAVTVSRPGADPPYRHELGRAQGPP